MNEITLDIIARLSVHEFLLEILYSNNLVQIKEKNAKAFVEDLKQRMKKGHVSPNTNQKLGKDYGLKIQQRAVELMDDFLEKALDRASGIWESNK
ncbi:MAG: hypothetical protein IH995_07370 [Proteobacteria bacterium]|nr:hypothetical protein [Pseudomonadota bacterium]